MKGFAKFFYGLYCRLRSRDLRNRMGALGRPVRIRQPAYIFPPRNVRIGDNVVLYEHCYIEAMGGVTIGNNVTVARHCNILSATHAFDGPEWDALPWADHDTYSPVTIGDNTWIGLNVTILPGVTIGEGAVIGTASVVTKDVPPCAIVAGNPAKVLRYRDEQRYRELKEAAAFNIIPLTEDRENLLTE